MLNLKCKTTIGALRHDKGYHCTLAANVQSVDLLSVSAMLEDVSAAWMDENISFNDCSGHAFERPELRFAPINQQ